MTAIFRRNFQILRDGYRQADRPTRQRHIILFALNFLTLYLAGSNFSAHSHAGERHLDALIFAVALSVILLGYALARFIQARSYGLYATLPFFIPMPLFSPFGTLGVVTRTAHNGAGSRALFDVAFWGPATSFLLSVPCLVAGTLLTDVVAGVAQFENPLLLRGIAKVLKEIPHGYDLAVHPLLAAGWAGLFFTAINLFPLGNLSGGQIAYALFGQRQRDMAYIFMAGLFVMALWYPMWFAFVLIFIYLGIEHPELRLNRNPFFQEIPQPAFRQPLDRTRQYLAAACALMFALSFTTRPFSATLDRVEERPPAELLPPDHYGTPPVPQEQAEPADENSI
ncbi:MAG: site-2 protease family protein [Turneriella sp.]